MEVILLWKSLEGMGVQRRTERRQEELCVKPDACLMKGKGWEGGLPGKQGQGEKNKEAHGRGWGSLAVKRGKRVESPPAVADKAPEPKKGFHPGCSEDLYPDLPPGGEQRPGRCPAWVTS